MKTLSTVNPDFDTLVSDAQNYLKTSTTNWKDLNASALGETIIELISAMAMFNQYSIEQSFRESFMHTAQRDSSIYAIAKTLGVRVGRKEPASYFVDINNKSLNIQNITPYSKFVINGDYYYNENQIFIPAVGGNLPTRVKLKQGTVETKTFVGKGDYFEEIYLNEPGFVVADSGMIVKTIDQYTGNSNTWSDIRLVTNGIAEVLWRGTYTTTIGRVFSDSTTGDGDVSLVFIDTRRSDSEEIGENDIYIRQGDTISVQYIKTKGSEIEMDLDSVEIEIPFNRNLSGVIVPNSAGYGANEKASAYYKNYAPFVFRSRGRAITKRDFHSVISLYPDVADVQVQGQRETYPNDVNWMNVIRVCVLPVQSDTWGGTNPNPHVNDPDPSSSRWRTFVEWLRPQMHEAYKVQSYNPEAVLVNIEIEVFMKPHGKKEELKKTIEDNIKDLFKKGIGTLGKSIPVSDIVKVSLIDGIDYVTLKAPVSDLNLSDGLDAENYNSYKLKYYTLNVCEVRMYYSERQTLEVYS